MTLNLKCITTWNLNKIPWFSNIQNGLWNDVKNHIDISLNNTNNNIQNENDLVITCIQGIYGYRAGLFGYTTKYLTSYLPYNPLYLKNIIQNNIECNDFDIISGSLTYITRIIPFFNIGVWDDKNTIFNHNYNNSILKHKTVSSSLKGGIFSTFCNTPILDNGCAIFSNRPPHQTGTFSFDYKTKTYFDSLINRGCVWNYYLSDNGFTGIMVLTFTSSDNPINNEITIKQLLLWFNLLRQQYSTNVLSYETYIVGEFENDLLFFLDDEEEIFKITHIHNNTYILFNTTYNIYENYENYENSQVITNYKFNDNRIVNELYKIQYNYIFTISKVNEEEDTETKEVLNPIYYNNTHNNNNDDDIKDYIDNKIENNPEIDVPHEEVNLTHFISFDYILQRLSPILSVASHITSELDSEWSHIV